MHTTTKVRSSAYHYDSHQPCNFSAGSPSSSKQEDDGQWDNNNGKVKFDVVRLKNNNQELDGEPEKEEKVEFQQCHKNLKCKVSPLHSEVGRDMFVDRPGKFVIELPGHNRHQDGAQSENTGDCNEKRLDIPPYVLMSQARFPKILIGLPDLVHLNCRINQQGAIEDTKTDNLNRVSQS